ncbi:MAG: 23S rRNA (pseudouridine(1915)-N(3))-methyltransferase RlmH [Gemmatimonadetes bacterium]|uniref:Ribosomal RNA large subunit methyltransferase H n=2 Tax=Bacteria TaxID=2 RepID=E7C4E2_9ACTN|nr:uncharacterized conserved protein [uncultured Gemmatimonadales bacterium HF0200_34B24]ADI22316.1 uncharacterized conserved protein [uncultured actinobacterium HF0500_01C15]MCH2461247.1 23S rRNA (pseudouridine(1915)-N(3))-methyltransferase RlmH [Gemmatimonadota bacterium]
MSVGRVKGALATTVSDYEDRASRYWKMDVIEVSGGTRGAGKDQAGRVREAEADRLLGKLPAELEIIALTRTGVDMSSRQLAGYLEGHAVRSSAGVSFVIGGAFGLAPRVLKRAHKKLRISSMTLPHEMARLVLSEQLYRAGSIIRGEPYHKG